MITRHKKRSVKIKEDKHFKETVKHNEKLRMAKLLVGKLEISNIDVLVANDKFFKKYPNGEISKDEFLKENKGNILAEIIFRVFDEDNSGSLNFYEYMMVKNTWFGSNLIKIHE